MGKGYLILENGAVFEGQTFGYDGEAVGELVFNTGMTGYLETLTDPSYYGQIVIQTFPLIGNYGVIPTDFESGGVQVKGYIVREWCQEPSNFRSEGELDTFCARTESPAIGLDTRELTRIVRESGSDELQDQQKAGAHGGRDGARSVPT
jgi:carbamoyl-phosphate synthase small subunit